MAFEYPGKGALDYVPCRYGQSKLLFRGPKKRLDSPYVVFFGGTETYGRFIEDPFPELVGAALNHTSVNLGCVNGGVDVYVNDATLLKIAERAQVTVIQVMGAQNLTNRYYSVHPRRNDRFIGPSELMRTVFADVDFTDFAFTRHLMSSLRSHCPQRHDRIVGELRKAWVERMRQLLAAIQGPKVLLWLADHAPDAPPDWRAGYNHDPLFVDRAMLDALNDAIDTTVEVIYDPAQLAGTTDGMVFTELETPAARATPGRDVHEVASRALVGTLSKFVG